MSNPSSAGQPLRILYADDMRELRHLIQVCLGRDGHVVETHPDGAEALERLTAAPHDFDVLLTDHHMPRMNGLELVEHLRKTAFVGKILVFSSELDESIADEYRKLGVDYILPKPIVPATLRTIIASLSPQQIHVA
ncbi:response regulator [Oleiharenicola lentus]|uniref:response regulator n=1 Tax=Oleiharenicola lentus TaxID=2508720 RepID=UPI003F673E00